MYKKIETLLSKVSVSQVTYGNISVSMEELEEIILNSKVSQLRDIANMLNVSKGTSSFRKNELIAYLLGVINLVKVEYESAIEDIKVAAESNRGCLTTDVITEVQSFAKTFNLTDVHSNALAVVILHQLGLLNKMESTRFTAIKYGRYLMADNDPITYDQLSAHMTMLNIPNSRKGGGASWALN